MKTLKTLLGNRKKMHAAEKHNARVTKLKRQEYWHGTIAAHVPSIRKTGLAPQEHKNWDAKYYKRKRGGAVYLTKDSTVAHHYSRDASIAHHERHPDSPAHHHKPVLVKVRASRSKLSRDNRTGIDRAVVHDGPVPRDRIVSFVHPRHWSKGGWREEKK